MEKNDRYAVKVSTVDTENAVIKDEFLYEIDRTCIYSSNDIKDAMYFTNIDDAQAARLLASKRTTKVCSIIIDHHEIIDYRE